MKYSMNRMVMAAAALAVTVHAGAQQTLENGIKMYNYKKYHTAEQILAPLAADAKANYYLGLSYLDEGNIAKAQETFSKFPEDPANIAGTARVAFANKDAAKGMQIAKDLAAKSKKKEWVQEKYAADAITYTTGGDYLTAVNWYKDALTKNGDDPDTHIGLGDAFRKAPGGGGGGDAMNNYEAVTDKDPKNSLALSRIGDLWYASHNWQGVTDNYAKAKDADPNNPLPYKALAEAYSASGKFQQALENIRKYYDLSDKTLADKIEMLEGLYRGQSNCDAVKFAKDMMSSEQMNADQKLEVTGVLGFSEANCGDSTEALQYLRTWFKQKNPSAIRPQAYIELGKLYLKLGMPDSAGVYYNKGIEGDTARNKTDIYRTIAEAFKAQKNYCKSAEWYDNLIKANPETQPLDYFWRTVWYFYCRDYTKAIKAGEDFEQKYPNEPTAIFWHGRALAAVDSEATTGAAAPTFSKWLDKVGPTYEKKNDLKTAYEYLVLYDYNSKEKDKLKENMEKLRTLDATDGLLKQIEEAEKAGTAPKKAAPPAKGKK
jgi:Tfp pilus assembly protein PilF